MGLLHVQLSLIFAEKKIIKNNLNERKNSIKIVRKLKNTVTNFEFRFRFQIWQIKSS